MCFEVRDEAGVKVEESNEGVKGLAGRGQGPIFDEVEFGGCGAIAVWPQVKADPFDSLKKEVAFLRVEREAPFGEDVADAFKKEDKGKWVIGEKEDVIDDLAVALLNDVGGNQHDVNVGKSFLKKLLPFLAKNEHQCVVACWCVCWAKRHDVERVLTSSWASKA